jgi:hypothetical protein
MGASNGKSSIYKPPGNELFTRRTRERGYDKDQYIMDLPFGIEQKIKNLK